MNRTRVGRSPSPPGVTAAHHIAKNSRVLFLSVPRQKGLRSVWALVVRQSVRVITVPNAPFNMYFSKRSITKIPL